MTPPVPRFVPTLTDVLGGSRSLPKALSGQGPGSIQPDFGEGKPLGPGLRPDPRATPEPVDGSHDSASIPVSESLGPTELSDRAEPLQAELVHRVLQRVDMMLADRLAAAVTTVIAQHTREMLPALREEIAEAVRLSVTDALSQELHDQLAAPTSRA